MIGKAAILAWGLFAQASSASSSIQEISLALGVEDSHVKDEHVSPDIYRGTLPGLHLAWSRSHGPGTTRLEGFYHHGAMTSNSDPIEQVDKSASVAAVFRLELARGTPLGLETAISALAGASWFLWNGLYADDKDLGSTVVESFIVRRSLDLGFAVLAERGCQNLTLEAKIPAVALVSRPRYSSLDNTGPLSQDAMLGGRFRWAGQDPAIEAALRYRADLWAHASLLAGYSFRCAQVPWPYPVRTYSNTFVLGGGFRW